MESLKIRAATAADLHQIYALVKELAIFEKEPNEPSVGFQAFEHEFKTYYDCFVAELDEKVIGIALYFWGYSTWKGKLLYLDDLVVKSEYRRHKIGSALFNKVMELAKEEHAGQVRWQVLDWNKAAIDMYKKADADFYTDWWTCKLEKEKIELYQDI